MNTKFITLYLTKLIASTFNLKQKIQKKVELRSYLELVVILRVNMC